MGQVFRWDNGEVIPGTEDTAVGRFMSLANRDTSESNVQFADFSGGLDLSYSSFYDSSLQDARFTDAVLRDSSFFKSELDRVDFSRADLTGSGADFTTLLGARFDDAIVNFVRFYGSGMTKEQLYSTKSYKDKDLEGIDLGSKALIGWDLSGQNLTSSNFHNANMNGVNLTDAMIISASLRTPLSSEQLYSTTSYKQKNLRGILFEQDLANFDFTGQDLSDAYFFQSSLAGAILTDADIRGACFGQIGLSQELLNSTVSYEARNLRRVHFGGSYSETSDIGTHPTGPSRALIAGYLPPPTPPSGGGLPHWWLQYLERSAGLLFTATAVQRLF